MGSISTLILEMKFRFESKNGVKPEFVYMGERDFLDLKNEVENTLVIHDLQGVSNPKIFNTPIIEVKKESFLRVG
jgi:hypothetical protein